MYTYMACVWMANNNNDFSIDYLTERLYNRQVCQKRRDREGKVKGVYILSNVICNRTVDSGGGSGGGGVLDVEEEKTVE